MTTQLTKSIAMKRLPYIKDRSLYQAVGLALWLYLDKRTSLKNAINKAAEKHAVSPKALIERLLREVIPEDVFLSRMVATKPKRKKQVTKTRTKEEALRIQMMKKMESESKQHISDIVRGGL